MSRPAKLDATQVAELVKWYQSPRTVADKARELGVTPGTIHNYVTGRTQPSDQTEPAMDQRRPFIQQP